MKVKIIPITKEYRDNFDMAFKTPEFKVNICEKMKCNPSLCEKVKNINCKNIFWKKECLMFIDHLELNT